MEEDLLPGEEIEVEDEIILSENGCPIEPFVNYRKLFAQILSWTITGSLAITALALSPLYFNLSIDFFGWDAITFLGFIISMVLPFWPTRAWLYKIFGGDNEIENCPEVEVEGEVDIAIVGDEEVVAL